MSITQASGEKFRHYTINLKPPSEEVFNCPDPKVLELYAFAGRDAGKYKYGAQAVQNEKIKF
jgi:hypothetical protein